MAENKYLQMETDDIQDQQLFCSIIMYHFMSYLQKIKYLLLLSLLLCILKLFFINFFYLL